jgi:hypothetical protein
MYPSDRLRFDFVSGVGREECRTQYAYIDRWMVADLWEASPGRWCVRRANEMISHNLKSREEAQELVRMLVDRIDDPKWRE